VLLQMWAKTCHFLSWYARSWIWIMNCIGEVTRSRSVYKAKQGRNAFTFRMVWCFWCCGCEPIQAFFSAGVQVGYIKFYFLFFFYLYDQLKQGSCIKETSHTTVFCSRVFIWDWGSFFLSYWLLSFFGFICQCCHWYTISY